MKIVSIILAVAICLALLGGCKSTDDTPYGATQFMSYAGPVFPLMALNGADGITATRAVTFDFMGFGETRTTADGLQMYHNDIRIADSYILTNNTPYDTTIAVLYPFSGSLAQLDKLRPAVTVDGDAIATQLIVGSLSGGFALDTITSWQGYVDLLSGGNYLSRAMQASAPVGLPVIVYEFSNIHSDFTRGEAPSLAASFDIDFERSTVLTFGFNGLHLVTDVGFMRHALFVPQAGGYRYDRSAYLVVIGDDIGVMSIQGYENLGLHPGQELDDVTADVTRFETTLSEILQHLLNDFSDSGWLLETDALDKSLLYDASMELLVSYGALSNTIAFLRYRSGCLFEIFNAAHLMERVFFLSPAMINIPAGESVSIRAEFIKPGSFDFPSMSQGNEGVNGYDILTRLDGSLQLTGLTAEILGSQYIEIVRQNFGVAPDSAVLSSALDFDEPHHFIEVRTR